MPRRGARTRVRCAPQVGRAGQAVGAAVSCGGARVCRRGQLRWMPWTVHAFVVASDLLSRDAFSGQRRVKLLSAKSCLGPDSSKTDRIHRVSPDVQGKREATSQQLPSLRSAALPGGVYFRKTSSGIRSYDSPRSCLAFARALVAASQFRPKSADSGVNTQTETWEEYLHRRAEYLQVKADQWKTLNCAESALQQAAR